MSTNEILRHVDLAIDRLLILRDDLQASETELPRSSARAIGDRILRHAYAHLMRAPICAAGDELRAADILIRARRRVMLDSLSALVDSTSPAELVAGLFSSVVSQGEENARVL